MTEHPRTILAVDDNSEGLFVLTEVLQKAGFTVLGAGSGEEALDLALKYIPDLILLDVNMPGIDGFETTKQMRQSLDLRLTPIILLTALDSLDDITNGFACGADDYIKKPYQQAELLARVTAGLRMQGVYRELEEVRIHNRELSGQLANQRGFGTLIGKSEAMAQVFSLMDRLRSAEVPVLITGESGTGKELVARALHDSSSRSKQALVIQNCSAFNENLLESEFFGHVKGAFTGAVRDKRGLFEEADNGTLFLDELGEMGLSLQAKLLRVLQDGTFTAVGDTKPKKVDVRIIAATNRSLEEMVKAGSFREDLYYRINVVSIPLPPLRQRKEDIPLLVENILQKHEKKQQRTIAITSDAMAALARFDWPGNVRQLQNEVERFLIMAGPDSDIALEHLSMPIRDQLGSRASSSVPGPLKEVLAQVEREMIAQCLIRTAGNKSEAAKDLGISRSNLIAKVKEYGIDSE